MSKRYEIKTKTGQVYTFLADTLQEAMKLAKPEVKYPDKVVQVNTLR